VPAIQKYLGWAQRFFYQVETGELPPLRSVLNLDFDWPLDVRQIDSSWVTIVGTVQTAVYAPGTEKHGLVWYCMLQTSVATVANDSMILHWRNPQGPNVALSQIAGIVGAVRFPLIGGKIHGPISATLGTALEGIPPVYVPAGGQLQIDHLSAVAATNVNATVLVIERQRSYPLRLP